MYFWTKVGAQMSVKYNVLTSDMPFASATAQTRSIFFLYKSICYIY